MPQRISNPVVVTAAGNKPKRIEEYVGRVSTGTQTLSVARMASPSGWEEPAQTPEFDEVTLVITGVLQVESGGTSVFIRPGESVLVKAGETVRYSTPGPHGAEYVAVCVPAFSPELAHRAKE